MAYLAQRHRAFLLIAFLLILPRPLRGQGSDTLVAKLADPDWVVRSAAVAALNQMSDADLPAGYAAAAIDLLAREVDETWNAEGPVGEGYGEYLIDVVLLVLRTGDPDAVRPLAFLGIDVSVGARRFLARHPDRALPALEEAWREHWPLRSDIVPTLGEMLLADRNGEIRLTETQRRIIDRRLFVAAFDSVPNSRYAFVETVGEVVLPEWTPVVASLAENDTIAHDRWSFIQGAAQRYRAPLEAARSALSDLAMLAALQRLHRMVCDDEAQGARFGQCTALASHLANAERQLRAGRRIPGRAQIDAYLRGLDRSAAQGIFTTREYVLLSGNASALLDRLN
ncbi:MAG TPA: hypothetical protein VF188_01165 [Longimicrobiales bacterium]